MTKTRILMCAPDFFNVDYVINPWMAGHEGTLDVDLVRQQWETLRSVLANYAEIELVEPVDGLPDMVYTANAGVVYGNKAVASHFIPHERRGEEIHFKQWFRSRGFELYDLPDKVGFEGAGDALIDRGGKWLWSGHGFRTEIEAHEHLREFFDIEVVALNLVDEHFYHLDTCFCPLTGGYLMYHPPAFDASGLAEIERRVPASKRIEVDKSDARNFACNAINVDDQVFVHRASPELVKSLARCGFKAHQSDVSEFLKGGGSAKCLSLKLTEPED